MNLLTLICFLLYSLTYSKAQTTTNSPRISCVNTYGNTLIGECKLADDCTGAALRGNCTSSGSNYICCIPDTTRSVPENSIIRKATFLKLVGNTTRNSAMYNFFVESMNLAGVNTNNYKAAAYLSQLAYESSFFRNLESGSIDQDFNSDLGNNLTGDGTKFQGRGAILIRGKTNYILANSSIRNLGFDIVNNPERVSFPSLAFRIAAWFWKENAFVIKSNGRATKGDLGLLADGTFHNFTLLTHALTNNIQKLKERASFNDLIIQELNFGTMKRGLGVECEISGEKGFAIPICLLDYKRPYCGCEGKYEVRSCPYGFTADNKCRSSSIIKCCIERCRSALDLVILMDSSGSIGIEDFKKEQRFVNTLLENLVIGENDTRVSVINYNTRPSIVVDFETFRNLNYTINKVNSIIYNGGNTYTFDALKLTNDVILQENKGMRPILLGIPKVVVVITDGASQNFGQTIFQAQRIKDRGFSIITVGVGKDINLNELIGMASTPADQFLVNDFNQILLILSGIARKTCQQPAQIIEETEVISKVEKDSYKYYKYSLKSMSTENFTLNDFTIELDEFNGRCELFFSFEDENPKSDEDFINQNQIIPENDENFIEKFLSFYKLNVPKELPKNSTSIIRKKYYQIKRPQTGQNEILYFSIKGYELENEFQVYVYNKTVIPSTNLSSTVSVWNLNIFYCLIFILLTFSNFF